MPDLGMWQIIINVGMEYIHVHVPMTFISDLEIAQDHARTLPYTHSESPLSLTSWLAHLRVTVLHGLFDSNCLSKTCIYLVDSTVGSHLSKHSGTERVQIKEMFG